MLDHLSLGTTDLARATRFYDAALTTLGVVRVWGNERGVGYGQPGSGDQLALKQREGVIIPGAGFHIALTARSRGEVDAFFAAAVAHGGTDRGEPGLRPQYGPGYYAAFVGDCDGYHVEVVFHEPA